MDTRPQGSHDQYDTAWLKGIVFMFGLLVVLMLING